MMLRNARTFERLKKVIMKGAYDQAEMVLDMTDFLELGTLTEKEFADLMVLMEQYPPNPLRVGFDEVGNLVSDSTYLLLLKQIVNKSFAVEVVEQIATDFRITNAITREQFKTLMSAIEDVYYPVVEEVPPVEEVLPVK